MDISRISFSNWIPKRKYRSRASLGQLTQKRSRIKIHIKHVITAVISTTVKLTSNPAIPTQPNNWRWVLLAFQHSLSLAIFATKRSYSLHVAVMHIKEQMSFRTHPAAGKHSLSSINMIFRQSVIKYAVFLHLKLNFYNSLEYEYKVWNVTRICDLIVVRNVANEYKMEQNLSWMHISQDLIEVPHMAFNLFSKYFNAYCHSPLLVEKEVIGIASCNS